LINNAGILGTRSSLAEYPDKMWEDVLRINLTGTLTVTKAVLNSAMLPAKRGSIINVSSGVGKTGKPFWGAYAVSKFGLEGLTQVLAVELKEHGIRVNAVNPGPTRTQMRANAFPQEDPMTLKPPEIAVPTFVYLASDDSSQITGGSFDLDPTGNLVGD
ncbi:MAG: SDR family NAD(P)-dependent oxidoreductase, partial [Elusimicrobia bacterium]|nr:SDR family NAD(P)-dependent oxidoreductase [Elusimicrobiota bacterium]